MLLYQAGCQWDGVQLASNRSRRQTANARLTRNAQRRFENSAVSLSWLPENEKVFYPDTGYLM
jgi:hypothetical protein